MIPVNLQSGLSSLPREHKARPLDPQETYDVLIIGGGPAALTAAVYCMRKGVTTGLITRDIGGQVVETTGIENYMGYTHIEGSELVDKFKNQVQQFEIAFGEGLVVTRIAPGDQQHTVHTDDGQSFQGRALIIATGKSPRKLNLPGERKYTGRGVAYCASCDAPFFRKRDVLVVGGGNSGIEAALDLVKVARQVTVVEYLDHLNADQILLDKLREYPNVDLQLAHEVKEIHGNGHLSGVVVLDRQTGQEKELRIDGLFVEIGLTPNSDLVENVLELNRYGEIVIDCSCHTSVPGIFAAGDVTTVAYKQIVIATGEGAKAGLAACDYLLKG